MPIKYLYFDDEGREVIEPFIRAITSKSQDIEIISQFPKEFETQFEELKKSDADGFIFDWRLDKTASEEGDRRKYRAGSLVQDLRTYAAETHQCEKPIVMWSTVKRIKRSYSKDITSQDLFDKVYVKEEINDNPSQTALELKSLVFGYKQIIQKRKIAKRKMSPILNLSKEYVDILDERIEYFFEAGTSDSLPAHQYALFILRELLEVPGPLIDELYLAARLGVDIENSGDWEKLKLKYLQEFAYTGPFHEGWLRWWSLLVEKWWDSFSDTPGPLPFLNAEERVAFLRKVTKLKKLTYAKPIEEKYSSKFWTICEIRKKPLDPSDGFMLESRKNFPWQERKYISKIAALNREHKNKELQIHTLDKGAYINLIKAMDA